MDRSSVWSFPAYYGRWDISPLYVSPSICSNPVNTDCDVSGALADPDVGLFVVPALLGVLVAFALKKVADRKLEMALRAALRELK